MKKVRDFARVDALTYGWTGTKEELIAYIDAALERVPEDQRATATLSVDTEESYEDTHYVSIGFNFTRPQTDEERARELASEKARQEWDRTTYARLKKQFEGSN